VTLTIDEGGIFMKTFFQEVRMKRESIQTIILKKNFINRRFIFKHNDPTIKKEIEFWTFFPNPVAKSLRSQGYSVSEDK